MKKLFVEKIFDIVNDSGTDQLIHWSEDGSSIVVQDEAKLAEELLPLFFKHNNFSSLVRQLHQYGFSKSIVDGQIYFHHDYFQYGRPDLLPFVNRKTTGTVAKQKEEIETLRSQVEQLKQENDFLVQLNGELRGQLGEGNVIGETETFSGDPLGFFHDVKPEDISGYEDKYEPQEGLADGPLPMDLGNWYSTYSPFPTPFLGLEELSREPTAVEVSDFGATQSMNDDECAEDLFPFVTSKWL